MNKIIFLLSLLIVANSCKKPEEEPEFRHVQNIQVKKITGNEVLLNAEAVFYNPNDMRMKLREIEVDVFVAGKKVGTINQDVNTIIPALDEFIVPFDATFNIKEIGGLNVVLNIMSGTRLTVRYEGHIKVTVSGLPFRVPVDYENDVKFR